MRWDLALPYRLIMKVPAVGWGLRPVGLQAAPDAGEPRRSRRSPRDWLVDVLCFLLAVGFTVLAVVDGIERQLGQVALALEAILGGLCCLGLWLRRRWPVGFAPPPSWSASSRRLHPEWR